MPQEINIFLIYHYYLILTIRNLNFNFEIIHIILDNFILVKNLYIFI